MRFLAYSRTLRVHLFAALTTRIYRLLLVPVQVSRASRFARNGSLTFAEKFYGCAI